MQTATLALADNACEPSTANVRPKPRRVIVMLRSEQCRHCQRRLSPWRTLFSKVPFCCKAHRHAYQREIDELMIERLKEAAERMRRAAAVEPTPEDIIAESEFAAHA